MTSREKLFEQSQTLPGLKTYISATMRDVKNEKKDLEKEKNISPAKRAQRSRMISAKISRARTSQQFVEMTNETIQFMKATSALEKLLRVELKWPKEKQDNLLKKLDDKEAPELKNTETEAKFKFFMYTMEEKMGLMQNTNQ